jgi:hypothetical protein
MAGWFCREEGWREGIWREGREGREAQARGGAARAWGGVGRVAAMIEAAGWLRRQGPAGPSTLSFWRLLCRSGSPVSPGPLPPWLCRALLLGGGDSKGQQGKSWGAADGDEDEDEDGDASSEEGAEGGGCWRLVLGWAALRGGALLEAVVYHLCHEVATPSARQHRGPRLCGSPLASRPPPGRRRSTGCGQEAIEALRCSLPRARSSAQAPAPFWQHPHRPAPPRPFAAAAEPRGPSARVADRDMEMEVSFMPGLEGLGARLLAKKAEEKQRSAETVWEAYMRRWVAARRRSGCQGGAGGWATGVHGGAGGGGPVCTSGCWLRSGGPWGGVAAPPARAQRYRQPIRPPTQRCADQPRHCCAGSARRRRFGSGRGGRAAAAATTTRSVAAAAARVGAAPGGPPGARACPLGSVAGG